MIKNYDKKKAQNIYSNGFRQSHTFAAMQVLSKKTSLARERTLSA